MGDRPVLADRYRLGRVLGRGGMAVVFEGVDDRLDRQVAIKVLRADLAADPGLRSRFESEARSAARLVHPNVVSVFDTGESGGRPYIVMERLSGETLADLIRVGPLGEAEVMRLGAEVLAGLSVAHGAGIIHRDIKPGNILMAGNGSVKVADFGIAKGIEPRPGQPSDLTSMAGAIQHTDPVPLGEHRPDVGSAVVATVARALARRPEDRFESAAQMADALTGRGLGEAVTAAIPGVAGLDPTVVLPGDPVAEPTSVLPGVPRRVEAGFPGALRPSSRRSRAVMVIAVLALALLGAVAAIVLPASSNGPTRTPTSPSGTSGSHTVGPSTISTTMTNGATNNGSTTSQVTGSTTTILPGPGRHDKGHGHEGDKGG